MNKSFIIWVGALGAAIVVAIAAIVVSNNRAAVARNERAAAEAKADAESAALKKARAEEATSANQAAAKKAESATAQEERKAAEAQAKIEEEACQRAEAEAKAQKARLAAAEKEEKIAADKASAAKALAEHARLTNEVAQATLHTAEAQQTAALAEAERVRLLAEKATSEAKLIELRKLDLEAYEQSLIEVARDLEEREAALKPDKTTADLVWLPDADTEVDENGKLRPRKKEPYLAENDKRLSPHTRELARQNRLRDEAATAESQARREALIAALEKLRQEAVATDRPLTAGYYRKVIESLYPDWTPSPENKEESKKEVEVSK